MVDRKTHDQSIGLGNRESRAAYFNIFSGVLCAGAAAGAKVAATAALNRKAISDTAQKVITYVGAGSIGFQVVGCADELICILIDLRERKPISAVYVAQFGAQLFLLALSVKNFKLTQTLTEVSGQRNPKTIRKMLRKNNSDGSFKYLFSGADFIEKNVHGLTSRMMLESIFSNCLNVVQKVKIECESRFDDRFKSILDDLSKKGTIKTSETDSMGNLLKFFLKKMTLRSLDKFIELTIKLVEKSSHLHKSKRNARMSFEFYLKSFYMSMINNENNANINDFLSALTDNSFEMMVEEMIADFTMVFFCFEFDEYLKEQQTQDNSTDLSLGRKIYLIIEEHCQTFITQFIELPMRTTIDRLAESIQYVLRRLTIEAAQFFFIITKEILKECAKFVVENVSSADFIKEFFEKLLKKYNGDLKLLEESLQELLEYGDEYDSIKKAALDDFVFSRNKPSLTDCKDCGGKRFI